MDFNWHEIPEGRAIVGGIVGGVGGLVAQLYRRALGPIPVDIPALWTNVLVSGVCSSVFVYSTVSRFTSHESVGVSFVVGLVSISLITGLKGLDLKEILKKWLKILSS